MAPYRCARDPVDLAAPRIPGIAASLAGPVLELEFENLKPGRLELGFVADARGRETESLTAMAEHRKLFTSAGVDIIVSLGGLAQEDDDIESLLGELVVESEALLIAIPGDREALPAHRKAVARLADRGFRVLDGSQFRLIRAAGLILANVPGISMSANLIAGDEGCQHTELDAANLLREGIREEDVLIVNSYAPIRAYGKRTHDRGLGAIHVGELALRPLLEHRNIAVVVHGLVAPTSVPLQGTARITQDPLFLSAGSVDPLEGNSDALLLSISGKKLSWRRQQVN